VAPKGEPEMNSILRGENGDTFIRWKVQRTKRENVIDSSFYNENTYIPTYISIYKMSKCIICFKSIGHKKLLKQSKLKL
jgi:hypothetical protein